MLVEGRNLELFKCILVSSTKLLLPSAHFQKYGSMPQEHGFLDWRVNKKLLPRSLVPVPTCQTFSVKSGKLLLPPVLQFALKFVFLCFCMLNLCCSQGFFHFMAVFQDDKNNLPKRLFPYFEYWQANDPSDDRKQQ